MAGTSQTITSHASIVGRFVGGLSKGCKTHNNITRSNAGIINHITAFETAGHCRVYYNSTHQVTQIGGFTSGGINANSHITHLLKQFVGAIDNS